MDLRITRLFNFTTLAVSLLILLSGCETHLSEDELEIVGEDPRDFSLYYDVEFEYEFGAAGGDGTYQYRYIQNPDTGNDAVGDEENHVELSIRVLDGEKSGFILYGVPELPEGVDFDSVSRRGIQFGIEITDGKNSRVQIYDAVLLKNTLEAIGDALNATEGLSSVTDYQRLVDAAAGGDETICPQATELNLTPTEIDGKSVYPVAIRVQLDRPVAFRTELFYEVRSRYREDLGERDPVNRGAARPGVDFIEEQRSIVFEQGQGNCFVYAYVVDDAVIEDSIEQFQFEFVDRQGALVDSENLSITVNLNDDEPRVILDPVTATINVGEQVVVPVRLSNVHDVPLTLNVSPVLSETTAELSEYELLPADGVISFDIGETTANYTIRLIEPADGLKLNDGTVVIATELDDFLNVEPSRVTANYWGVSSGTESEIVAYEENLESAVDLDVSPKGRLLLGVSGVSDNGDDIAGVRGYARAGQQLDLLESGAIEVSKTGLDVTFRALDSAQFQNNDVIAVVSNVNGLMVENADHDFDLYRGGIDFVVSVYVEDNDTGMFELDDMYQFGTEGDDIVEGAAFDDSGNLYIHGSTDGTQFDGVPSQFPNNGGKDGFIYKIAIAPVSVSWSRFVGSSEEDKTVGLARGRSEIAVLNQISTTDIDSQVSTFTATSGQAVEGVDSVNISSVRDDSPAAIDFDKTGSVVYSLLNSVSELPSGNLNSSLSEDAQLLAYGVEGDFLGSTVIATSSDDFGRALSVLSEEDILVTAGETLGEFETGGAKGGSGSDAFVAYLSTEDSQVPRITKNLQFGTAGEDQVIDIEEVSDRKFMVLWSENYTDGSGRTRYRISPFTPEGRKLTLDP